MTNADNECVVRLDDLGAELDRWTSYVFSSSYMTPADGFSFQIGDPEIPRGLSGQIREGMKVTLTIDGRPTMTGYIDDVHAQADRTGGTQFQIAGRDVLGDVVDSGVDPALKFEPTQTLRQVLETLFKSYGLGTTFDEDNDVNRDLITGNKHGYRVNKTRVTAKGKVTKGSGQALKSFIQHRAKPYDHEGAFAFAERIARQQGFHIHAKADGTGVVVTKPDFAQEHQFTLTRKRGEAGSLNTIVSGGGGRSRREQPSIIIAKGAGGGGDFARARLKVAMVNELVARGTDGALVPGVQDVLDANRDAVLIGLDDLDGNVSPLALNPYPRCRPMYLYDPDSRDIEQLKNFVKREMATRQQSSLGISYEVDGHTQNGMTWAVDTIVSVDDDVLDIHEDLWIMGVTFQKDRASGTRTDLTLIRPWTLQL